MAQLEQISADCNYTGYTEKFLGYPPKGLLPLPGDSIYADDGCDIWDLIYNAALLVNPGFNIYHIFDTFPILWDVLGFPWVNWENTSPIFSQFYSDSIQTPIYFNRTDVKKAIHAPLEADWEECSTENVFLGMGDESLPSAFTVLPKVIEKNVRTVIVHGLADFILLAEGFVYF